MKNKTFSLLLIAALIAAALGAALPAQPVRAAGIMTVNTADYNLVENGECSLSEALNNAALGGIMHPDCLGATSGANIILITNAFTITMPDTRTIANDVTIAGSYSILQAAATPDTATHRLFYVTSGGTLRLGAVILRHGRCNGSCEENTTQGGAILNLGVLELENATIEKNTGSSIVYTGTGSSVSVFQSAFRYNLGSALAVVGGAGDVEETVFYDNNGAYQGAAVYGYDFSALNLRRSSFLYNDSIDYGGAIYAGNSGSDTTLRVTNSTFYDNSAKSGGALATGSGQSAELRHSTMYDNRATDPAGISGIHVDNLYMVNSMIADNSVKTDCSAFVISSNVTNFVGDGSCSPALTGNPKLGALFPSSAGFKTYVFPLLPTSPLLNAADDTACGWVGHEDIYKTTRPKGAHCDIGSYEADVRTDVFRSDGTQDGWVLEFSEAANVGGSQNSSAVTFNLGDGANDKQYRGFLSFDTSSMPDTAVVTKVSLKIKQSGAPVGTNPFTILGTLRVDIRKPYFGASAALAKSDFQASASAVNIGSIPNTPVSNWYTRNWTSGAFFSFINSDGTTQFRLYFAKDDNNDNGADYMQFISGNHATVNARPTLIVEYYVLPFTP